ncbi:MAG: carotenoid oxygenase family protein [Elainellaceae cyanobacterium]
MQRSLLGTNQTDKSYDRHEWQSGYRSLRDEFDYWIDDIEGQIPSDLYGTLFRNGPGSLDINNQQFQHPFDGDGMICAIAFKDGRAHFRNRYVRTEGLIAEQQAGQILYRGVFGTQKPGGWLANAFDFRLKNIANTQVIYWGGRLLALWEAAEPYRLDPHTLETVGIDDLGGVLPPGSAFAAHPWIDPPREENGWESRMVNFSIKPGLSTTITIYELNADGTVIDQHAHSVPGFAFIHDFAITPNYCIFFQSPIVFNPVPYAFGFRSAAQCLQVQANQPTQVIVIPRHSAEPVQMIPTQAGFVFHHANAFEANSNIVVDSVCYDELPAVDANQDYRQVNFDELAPGQLWRFEIDWRTQTILRQQIISRCCEFPAIHPDRTGCVYRYVFLGAAHAPTGNAPLQAILKLDYDENAQQLWSEAPHGYVSEPVFVPRPNATGEDDGWVFSLVYNATRQKSELIILDGHDIEKGPVARLRLKHHVPYGLHGSFTPEYFGPE